MRLRDSYVVPEEPVFKAKKDRAKWCGGKPGREHDYRWRVAPNAVRFTNYTPPLHPICENCGRQKPESRWWCRLHLQYEEWNEAWAHNREVKR